MTPLASSPAGVLRKTLRHVVGYGLSVGLSPLTNLLLLPLYTRALSTEAVGVLALLLVTSGVLAFLYDLGMINALFRRYFEYGTADDEPRRTVLSTAWAFLGSQAAVGTLVGWWLWAAVAPAGWRASPAGGVVPLMLVSTMVTSWADVPTAALRARGRVRAFGVVAALRCLGLLAATYGLVVRQSRGLAGVFESQLLVSTIALGSVVWLTRWEFGWRVSGRELAAMLKFGLPFFPALLFTWVIDCSDRYFLGWLGTLPQVAVYAVSYKIGQIPLLAVKAFMVAWIPLMFSLAKSPEAPRLFSTVFRYYSAGVWLLGLGLSLWAEGLLGAVSTAAYQAGSTVVPLVALACAGYGLYSFMLSGLLVTKDVWVQPITLGAAAVLNALLNWWTIPRWGMWGAAWATAASYWLAAGVTWWAAQRRYPIPVRLGWVAGMALGAVGAYELAHGLALGSWARLAVWLGYGTLLWRAGIVAPREWRLAVPSETSLTAPSIAVSSS